MDVDIYREEEEEGDYNDYEEDDEQRNNNNDNDNRDLDEQIATLRSLISNGIAKRFDVYQYSQNSNCFYESDAMERARMIFEQIRPQVLKLMVLEEMREKTRTNSENALTAAKKAAGEMSRSGNFVYGEVVLEPFFDFLSRSCDAYLPPLPPFSTSNDEVFSSLRKYYDLGSGTGKSVFIAALTGKFSFAGGCEILECLHGVATTVVEDYREIIEPMMKGNNASNNSNSDTLTTELRVELDDIFSVERVRMWSQCEYVFCNCLTWEDEQMERLAHAAENMKEGSIFVSVLLPLPSEKFEVIAEEECLFSWGGEAPLVIHKKRRQLEGENDLLASLQKMNDM